MGETSLNRDEWLAALGEAVKPVEEGALSCDEIAQQFAIGRQAAYQRLAKLVDSGRARKTWKMRGNRRVPAYVLLPQSSPAKGKPGVSVAKTCTSVFARKAKR